MFVFRQLLLKSPFQLVDLILRKKGRLDITRNSHKQFQVCSSKMLFIFLFEAKILIKEELVNKILGGRMGQEKRNNITVTTI